MKAVQIQTIGTLDQHSTSLSLAHIAIPEPSPDEILLKVSVCGVCHTELDQVEGRIQPAILPITPGHQVVGRVVAVGTQAGQFALGERVGVAWIYSSCGVCTYCLSDRENLCSRFKATGLDVNGGYAEYMLARAEYAYPMHGPLADRHAAPLLCAGAIGYRSIRLAMVQDNQALGLTGFGASAHLVLKLVRHRWPDTRVHVFARNPVEREHALALGAVWAGNTSDTPPEQLDSIIDTTPAWLPIVEALEKLKPGGRLVINAIRKEDGDKAVLQNIQYPAHLWLEKEIKSVANVTRRDVREFLQVAGEINLQPEVHEYALDDAIQALRDVKQGKIRGAKVLRIARDE